MATAQQSSGYPAEDNVNANAQPPSGVEGVSFLPPPASRGYAVGEPAGPTPVEGISFLPAPGSRSVAAPPALPASQNSTAPLPSPQEIEAALHDPNSDDLLDDRRARALWANMKQQSFGDKAADVASGAWEGAKGVASTFAQAGGELVHPSNAVAIPSSLVHGAVLGTAQTAELLRQIGRRSYDFVRDLPTDEATKIEHFKERYNANLISQRALARGNTPDKTLIPTGPFPKPLPGVTGAASMVFDPITIATAGGNEILEAPLKGILAKAATAVPGGARAIEALHAAKAIPGTAARAGLGTAETVGRVVKEAARWPGEKAAEIAERVLPAEAAKHVQHIAENLGVLGAVEGLAGHGGVIGHALAATKIAEGSGLAVEQTANFAKRLTELEPSAVPRLLRLSRDPDAPQWVQAVAQGLHNIGAGTAARVAMEYAGTAARGAAMGAALGAASQETPEQIGQSAGSGAGLGALGRAVGKVIGTDARSRALRENAGDLRNLFTTLKAQGVDDAAIKRLQTDPALAMAKLSGAQALALFGKRLNLRFLPGSDYDAAMPEDGKGTAAYFDRVGGDAGAPAIAVNLDKANDRAFGHELVHAVGNAVGADGEARLRIDSLLSPDQLHTAARDYAGALLRNRGVDPASITAADWNTRVEKTIGDLDQKWGGNRWLYDEIYAEAGWGAVAGKDLIRDIAAHSVRRSLSELGGQARAKVLAALGANIDPDTAKRANAGGALFTNPAIYNSPQLRQLVAQHLRKIYEAGPARAGGRESKEGLPNAVELPPGLIGAHPAAPAPQLIENGIVQPGTGGALRPASPAVFRTVEKAKEKEGQKVFVAQPVKPRGDTSPEVAPRIGTGGEREISGMRVSDQLATMKSYGPWAVQVARAVEKLIGTGQAFGAYYHAIGNGYPWAKSVRRELGNIPVSRVELAPFVFGVSKAGNVLVTGLSITAAERKLALWSQAGKINLFWGGDANAFRADLKRYLQNHAEGLSGAANGIGSAKRDVLNLFTVGKQARFADLNPLRAGATGEDRGGIIRSLRLDRIATVENSEHEGWHASYERQRYNYSPAAPVTPQAPAPGLAPGTATGAPPAPQRARMSIAEKLRAVREARRRELQRVAGSAAVPAVPNAAISGR